MDNKIKRLLNLIKDRKKIIEENRIIYEELYKELFVLANSVYDNIKLLISSKEENGLIKK